MAKMGVIQVAISGVAAYSTTLSETEREYLDFSANPRKWKRLSDEDQKEKAHPVGQKRQIDVAGQKLPRDNFCLSLVSQLPSPRG